LCGEKEVSQGWYTAERVNTGGHFESFDGFIGPFEMRQFEEVEVGQAFEDDKLIAAIEQYGQFFEGLFLCFFLVVRQIDLKQPAQRGLQ